VVAGGLCSAIATPARLPGPFWVKLLAVLVLGGAAVLLPRLSAGGGQAPTSAVLLSVGLLLTIFTAGALTFGLKTDLRLPTRVVIYAVAYNALIIGVKFVMAPQAVYELNRTVELESFVPFTTGSGAVLSAVLVFGLYAGALGLIYLVFRRRRFGRGPRRLRAFLQRNPSLKVVVPLVAVFLFASAGPFILLIGLVAGLDYLGYLFSSGLSLAIALALVAATALASAAFQSVSEQALAVRDAALLSGFFWAAVSLLAVYHLLWVVYILVLTTIWPLRVVVPK
jgi:hypothetical protein